MSCRQLDGTGYDQIPKADLSFGMAMGKRVEEATYWHGLMPKGHARYALDAGFTLSRVGSKLQGYWRC